MNRLLALLAAALLAGCVTSGPYDYGLEVQVIKMDERLRDLLWASRSRPPVAGEAQSFLHDSLVTLQLLHDRAFAHHERSEASALAEFLRRRMQALGSQKARLTRTDLRRLAPPVADLREMEVRRSDDYRDVPVENIRDYDAVDFEAGEVYDARRGDHGHHGNHNHDGGGGHHGGHR